MGRLDLYSIPILPTLTAAPKLIQPAYYSAFARAFLHVVVSVKRPSFRILC